MTAAVRQDSGAAVRGVQTPDAIERDYQRFLERRLETAHELVMRRLDDWLTGRRRDINARARQDSVSGDVQSLSRTIEAIRVGFGKKHSGDKAEERARKIGSQVSAFNKEAQKRVFREVAGLDPTFGDRGVKKRLKGFTRENVDLITGLEGVDQQYFRQVEDKLVEALKEGRRHEDFADIVQDRLGVAESRARLIARDQVQKLHGRLTQMRQQELGVRRYEWSTAGDERVRDSHAAKDGEVFEWSNPPTDTGHPGEDILCRCVAIPKVEEVLKARTGQSGAGTSTSVTMPENPIGSASAGPAGGRGAGGRVPEGSPNDVVTVEGTKWTKDSPRSGQPAQEPIELDSPNQHGTHRGVVSRRPFHADEMSVPLEPRSMKGVEVTKDGVERIRKHLERLDSGDPEAAMLDRLERIADGELTLTEYDIRFYTHELREFERFKAAGWESGIPDSVDEQRRLWDTAHTATLEEYGVHEKDKPLYHPDVPDGT